MKKTLHHVTRFFRIISSGQAYLNLIYLLAAFPLGILYFIFLITGLSTGISLTIIWIGVPILLLVGFGWWMLAGFERFMAIHLLKEDMPIERPLIEDSDIWTFFKEHLADPITWKSLCYLILKFPLGMATFVILVTLISITLVMLIMPLTFESQQFFQTGFFLGSDLAAWQIDSLSEALLCTLIGLVLLPTTLHISNGLAWLHAKFARMMLSDDPMGGFSAIAKA